MRKSFILHKDSLDVLDDLSDEQAGQLFKAIKAYQCEGQIELNALIKIAFSPFKNQFMRDENKYQNIVDRNKINGSRGGRPNKQKEPTGLSGNPKNPEKPQKADSDSKSDSKSDSEKNKTLDQSAIDPELFEQFWTSGIRKVNKKKSLILFNNLLKKQPDQKDFTTKLIIDVKARCKSNQLGFAEMHPTTYLNGERWEDTITHRAPLADERKTTFENLTDRSWADSIIQPKQIGAIYEA
jgi:hypothetical protein